MVLSAEQKDLIAGFVNRQEVAQLIGYLESLERPQVAPDQPPADWVFGRELPAIEAQAEAETASAVAEAEKPGA